MKEVQAVVGSCLCAGVHIELQELSVNSPAQITICHCTACRKASGALSVHWAACPRNGVNITGAGGQGSGMLKHHRVSSFATRSFCGGCGAQVAMDYGEKNTIWISCGLLGADERFVNFLATQQGTNSAPQFRDLRYPSGHIFWESRCLLYGITQPASGFRTGDEFGCYVPDCCAPQEQKNWRNSEDSSGIQIYKAATG
eukprot:gnl/TRDRNA2_/TRDRNA2_128607_c0_seq1.p1 gnl/TRDRNA2_/TRDRNA2_128607_c0~~gnl/TRDRNA2_/TRDRNA2_128607_c0_seq1.p1  ORF type:complete len:199 (+),score=17.44 gnl/TRDRNA2_/TRDRNA2_128607_c0_seq1:286-882(+)